MINLCLFGVSIVKNKLARVRFLEPRLLKTVLDTVKYSMTKMAYSNFFKY